MTHSEPPQAANSQRGVVAVLVGRVGTAFSLEGDDESERLRKAVMASSVLLICIGGAAWAVAYAVLGDLRSASIPLAFVEAEAAGRIEAGQLVLLTGFGAGMSSASAVLRWGP